MDTPATINLGFSLLRKHGSTTVIATEVSDKDRDIPKVQILAVMTAHLPLKRVSVKYVILFTTADTESPHSCSHEKDMLTQKVGRDKG